ncbi:hypothetical protein NCH01_26080 [Neoasaia chiangmaiensis]|nr:hypothetical protein NCH01_26080 [Neoasaia chiangmaiensis]
MPGQGGNDRLCQFGRDERARTVMHQNEIGWFGQGIQRLKTGADAMLAFRATADGRQDIETVERVEQGRIGADGLEHVDMRQQRFGGMADNGFPAKKDELFGGGTRDGGFGEASTGTGGE